MLNLPNAITLTRIALVVVFTAAVSVADQYSWGYLAALVTFILAACTDWLDGYLARRLNQVTTFGKLIDPLADKIAVSAAFIYLTGEGLCPAWDYHSHHQQGIPGHRTAPDCAGSWRHHPCGNVRQMENRIPAGLLHRLPAGPDMDAYAGIPALHRGPAGRALPVARFRRIQLAVPGYAVGLRHPDRLFRSRLLRGRPQIPEIGGHTSFTTLCSFLPQYPSGITPGNIPPTGPLPDPGGHHTSA